MSETSVRDVMPWPPRLAVEVAARPALELLIGLSAATSATEPHEETWAWPRSGWSGELASAVAACGERSGEAWLHLLGLALELSPSPALEFAEALGGVDALELRRHLVGVHVPAWVTLVGADALEAAAEGDERAIAQLLDHPRYYGTRARESLSSLLAVSPEETKNRLLALLRQFAEDVFDRMARALHEYRVEGLATCIEFHRRVMAHPAFVHGDLHTGFLDEHRDLLAREPDPEFERLAAIAAAVAHLERRRLPAAETTVQEASPGPSAWRRSARWSGLP